MWNELKDQPLMMKYVINARHQVLKMQNTHSFAGEQSKIDQGMVAIDAERDAYMATLRPQIEAMPTFASLDQSENTSHKEPDRTVINAQFRVRPDAKDEDVKRWIEDELKERSGLDDLGVDLQLSSDVAKQCSGCGKQALLVGKKVRGSSLEQIQLKACARCGQVYYCSRECQKSHWETHRPMCIPSRGSTGTSTGSLSNIEDVY